jgi:hypothetical protein
MPYALLSLFGALSKNSQIDAWLEKYRNLWEDLVE